MRITPRLRLLAIVLSAACGCTHASADDAAIDTDASLTPDVPRTDTVRIDSGHRDARPDVPVFVDDVPFDTGTDLGPPIIPPTGPLAMTSMGGPVISVAQLVTIDWSDFPIDAEMQRLGDFLPTSDWLRATGSEYGVTVAGHSHYTLSGTAPPTLSWADMSALIDAGIASDRWTSHPGNASAEPIWLFFIPSTTTADAFMAAHYSFGLDGGRRVLAYVRTLDPPSLGDTEFYVSHELIEALTDPFTGTVETWRGAGVFNGFSGGGENEVADICVGMVMEGGHTLCRSWSNASSLAGHAPCVPTAPRTFVGLQGPTGPIRAARGALFDVTLTAIGDDPSATFDLTAINGTSGPLGARLFPTRVHPGDTVRLTLSVPTDLFAPTYERIDSSVGGTTISTWPIEVIPLQAVLP